MRLGKGKKDRVVAVAGRAAGALQSMLRQHAKAAGLQMKASPHTPRHSGATHLPQGEADIRHVQPLLAHQSIESTAIYTRVFPKTWPE